MRYFDHLFTVPNIKAEYRDLAFKHHPDRGGDVCIMQAINAQYHEALQRCNGERSEAANGKEHRYSYDADIEQAVMDKIMFLVAAHLPGVNIALIGTWLWVTGDTKPHKELLKANGLKWHPTRSCWYFTATPNRYRPSRLGLSGLAMRYGYKEFKDEAKQSRRSIQH